MGTDMHLVFLCLWAYEETHIYACDFVVFVLC